MADLPWYKYFPTLFDSDTALLSNQEVGGWQRLCNYMNPKNIETIEGDIEYFSRILRCQADEAYAIITALQQQETCNVNISRSKIITLTSRRIKKANNIRENNKIRKQKQRGYAIVTPEVTHDVTPHVTGEKLEVRSYIKKEVKKENKKKEKERAFILPIALQHLQAIWNDFLAMRKQIKKPASDRAQLAISNKLIKLRDSGNDPQAVLEQSIINNWRDVFPLKDNGSAKPKQHETTRLGSNEFTDQQLLEMDNRNQASYDEFMTDNAQ